MRVSQSVKSRPASPALEAGPTASRTLDDVGNPERLFPQFLQHRPLQFPRYPFVLDDHHFPGQGLVVEPLLLLPGFPAEVQVRGIGVGRNAVLAQDDLGPFLELGQFDLRRLLLGEHPVMSLIGLLLDDFGVVLEIVVVDSVVRGLHAHTHLRLTHPAQSAPALPRHPCLRPSAPNWPLSPCSSAPTSKYSAGSTSAQDPETEQGLFTWLARLRSGQRA